MELFIFKAPTREWFGENAGLVKGFLVIKNVRIVKAID